MKYGGVLNTTIDESTAKQRVLDEANSQGVRVDGDFVVATLARWIGWYRLESDVETSYTPKEQRTEAEEIIRLLTQLRERMQPHNMSPNFRAELQRNMQTLGVSAPDWARLEVCARKAGEALPAPRRAERRDTEPKYNAIRRTYEAILSATTPQMNVETAAALASELVGLAAGIKTPSDRDELRRITRGS